MSLNSESKEKIFYALKSLYRFATLKALNGPQILFDTESKLMKSKILDLEPEELYTMVNMWQDFLKDQMLEDAIEDNKLYQELDSKFAESVN